MSSSQEDGIREFLAEAEDILEAVADDLVNLESAEDDDPDPERINSIFRGAHSLKGISAMFGFTQVTELSHKAETLLDAVRMGRVSCDRGVLDLLFGAVDLLKTLCGRVAAGAAPEDPAVAPFVERLLAAAAGKAAAAADPLLGIELDASVRQVLSDYELHRIEATLHSPNRTLCRVQVAFPLESFDTDLERLNDVLKVNGEIISTLPGAGEAAAEHLEFDLLVGAKVSATELAAATAEFHTVVAALTGGHPTPPVALPSAPQETPVVAPLPPPAAAVPRDTDGDLRSLTQTIRVDLPKLDLLMNLVGELVLAKGRIQMVSERLRRQVGLTGEVVDLSKAQKDLERKLEELQQGVMDVRMVPLGQLFSKLHRVLRKILQGMDKQVDLQLYGAETELDKLIVEDLSDPLIHVLRNSVDHGIETPQVRLAAGKPAKGVIKIAARQRGNHVVIEVSDDGAGLSRERIRAKAEERGLIAPGARLEDRDLFDLVFLPGFSTKAQATELSGRGVGMDVLRKNIAALSGMIEMSSEEGRGTSINIVLPITLAIIQALVVRLGEHRYAIPLSSVLETLALDETQVRYLEGRSMLRLRDATMPLMRVDRLLAGKSAQGAELPPYAVVVGVAEKRVAFGVDGLVSQQDVVIKSLGRRLAGLRGLSGATDLGDQKTLLVLDVGQLVNEVFAVAP